MRPVRILQTGARAADGVRHRVDRLVLADDALVQPLLHVQQLLDLAFEQSADRNAGPAADDLGDVLGVDLFLEQLAARLQLGQPASPARLASVARSSASLPYCSSAALFKSYCALRLLDLDAASARSAPSARSLLDRLALFSSPTARAQRVATVP